MNIFHLHDSPQICAQYHNDKHVVKMCVEYAQLLSTSHRVLDGSLYYSKTKNGRKIRRWLLDDNREPLLYKASHINHPSNLWTRSTDSNYRFVFDLWDNLCKEYSYRYNREHMSFTKLREVLSNIPDSIHKGPITKYAQAMPDDCKMSDSIEAYRTYYRKYKGRFSRWTRRNEPEWFRND